MEPASYPYSYLLSLSDGLGPKPGTQSLGLVLSGLDILRRTLSSGLTFLRKTKKMGVKIRDSSRLNFSEGPGLLFLELNPSLFDVVSLYDIIWELYGTDGWTDKHTSTGITRDMFVIECLLFGGELGVILASICVRTSTILDWYRVEPKIDILKELLAMKAENTCNCWVNIWITPDWWLTDFA